MIWITRWHFSERLWEPIRRWLFRAKQLRIERDYWKEIVRRYAADAAYWQLRAEAAENKGNPDSL